MMLFYTQASVCQHVLGIQFLAELNVRLKKKKKTFGNWSLVEQTYFPVAEYQCLTGWLLVKACATTTERLLEGQFL